MLGSTLAVGLALGAACSAAGPDEATVVVLAAASLSEVITSLESDFAAPAGNAVSAEEVPANLVPADIEPANLVPADSEPADSETAGTSHATVRISALLAGSSSLVAQLAEGAPADILITADEVTMQRAVAAGSVRGEVSLIASNTLVLAVAPGNPAGITGIADLSRADLLWGLCAGDVPCGALADQALAAAGITPAVATRELNVRALATKIALGELDGGLIYATDAAALGLPTVTAGQTVDHLARFVNRYPMASVSPLPRPAVQLVLDAFEPGGSANLALRQAGFKMP